MDYSIPRQQLIEERFNNFAIPLATDVCQNVLGYNASIQPREYNLTKAKNLMKEVFGKSYDNSNDAKANETVTITPYFQMTIVSPLAMDPWMIPLISRSFHEIGIDLVLKWWNTNILMPRIYLDPVAIGASYALGGFDTLFIEQKYTSDPDYSSNYFISRYAPVGSNFYWINNERVTSIINASLIDPDIQNRLASINEFQNWFYEEVPKSIILQKENIFAVDKDFEGFDSYLIGRGWCFNNWTIGTQTSMTYTLPGDFYLFNPLLSNSYFDSIPLRNVFGALAQPTGSQNITHLVPQIAQNWTQSIEGTEWEVIIRDGIKWSDGSNLTADDVMFSYHSVSDSKLFSPYSNFFRFRKEDIYIKEGTNNTIIFNLLNYYPYVESRIFTLPVIQKSQWENIPYNEWDNHILSLGTGTEFPRGCGPYMITNYSVNSGIELQINPEFNEAVFNHDPQELGGGDFFASPTLERIHIIIVRDAISALDGLQKGVYDIIDPQTGINFIFDKYGETNEDYKSKFFFSLDYSSLQLCYNHYDARWGMNAHHPCKITYDCTESSPPENDLLIIFLLITYLPILTMLAIYLERFLTSKFLT
jgi:ABC-type transport system substrate-binding protein